MPLKHKPQTGASAGGQTRLSNRRFDRGSDQNTTFSPSCVTRGSLAELIFPKVGRPKVVPGAPKKGVLVKLKNSARNWALIRSLYAKFFSTETSEFTDSGFEMMPAPALPKKLPTKKVGGGGTPVCRWTPRITVDIGRNYWYMIT